MKNINIVLFRRNLRIHDNPVIHSALQAGGPFMAIYIFDTSFPELFPKSENPQQFLLECLEDLNCNLKKVGGRLHVFRGCPLAILRSLHQQFIVNTLCFDDDYETVWKNRNAAIEALSIELGFHCIHHGYNTLWNPLEIISANGGSPPLTFDIFSQIAQSLGKPSFPLSDVNWTNNTHQFISLKPIITTEFELYTEVPKFSDLSLPLKIVEFQDSNNKRVLLGGETQALKYLGKRLQAEERAFLAGLYQPNQARPNILGLPLSLSASLSFGALSIRLFYWKVHELYRKVNQMDPPIGIEITGQLKWREYFYSLVRYNPFFNQIQNNLICLDIPWRKDDAALYLWKKGHTGYPFIDAGMRQLLQEGWIHHTVRSAVALFLTRGDLWLNWEEGHAHFMTYLIDGDLPISAGNWMWLSSSAFDRMLDCSLCIDPVLFGKRLEPSGDYIRRYVPELAKFEFDYIHEPWKAPLEVQRAANCLIGNDYPERIVLHEDVSPRNRKWMKDFVYKMMGKDGKIPDHCHPSAIEEINKFLRSTEFCQHSAQDKTFDAIEHGESIESEARRKARHFPT